MKKTINKDQLDQVNGGIYPVKVTLTDTLADGKNKIMPPKLAGGKTNFIINPKLGIEEEAGPRACLAIFSSNDELASDSSSIF